MVTPIFEWGFNEASGDVIDLRNNGYNFTPNVNGQRVGGAFTQNAAAIQFGPALTGLQTPQRSMMVDAKAPGADPSWFLEFHRAGTDDTGVWGFLNLSGTFRFRVKDATGAAYDRTLTADTINFHNFCVTYDGAILKVYRDGVQVGADIAVPSLWGADDFRVLDNSGSSCFIDNVRYFTTALSPAEVNQWMNTPSGQNPSQPGGNMANSLSDIQAAKLPALSGINGSVPDMLFKYYSGLSGLAPATSYSRTDHERAYYVAQTGSSGSIADLERAFYDVKAVPAGSLQDRAYAYWDGLP